MDLKKCLNYKLNTCFVKFLCFITFSCVLLVFYKFTLKRAQAMVTVLNTNLPRRHTCLLGTWLNIEDHKYSIYINGYLQTKKFTPGKTRKVTIKHKFNIHLFCKQSLSPITLLQYIIKIYSFFFHFTPIYTPIYPQNLSQNAKTWKN